MKTLIFRVGAAWLLSAVMAPSVAIAKAPFKTPTKDEFREKQTLSFRQKYDLYLNSLLGMHVAGGAALATSWQARLRPKGSRKYYGAALDFSLFSQGSVLSSLLGLWYAMGNGLRNKLEAGVMAGPSFNDARPGFPGVTLTLYGEVAVLRWVDERVAVRISVRGGVNDWSPAAFGGMSLHFRI